MCYDYYLLHAFYFLRFSAAIECNETLGILPCFDGGCYQKEQQCDGVRQCEDGADELGCECHVTPDHVRVE